MNSTANAKINAKINDLGRKFKESKSEIVLGQIMECSRQSLQFFIGKYISGYDDIEEISSRTFVRVWEYIDRYDVSQRFNTWMFTLAKNECLNFIRFKKKHTNDIETYTKDLTQEDVVELHPVGQELENELYGIIKYILLNEYLVVNAKCAKCLYLHLYKNMTTLQIATLAGISESSVKTWVRKGKKDVHAIVKSKFPQYVEYYMNE